MTHIHRRHRQHFSKGWDQPFSDTNVFADPDFDALYSCSARERESGVDSALRDKRAFDNYIKKDGTVPSIPGNLLVVYT